MQFKLVDIPPNIVIDFLFWRRGYKNRMENISVDLIHTPYQSVAITHHIPANKTSEEEEGEIKTESLRSSPEQAPFSDHRKSNTFHRYYR